jgi:tetratricopeptide (TPR) repeat protein
MPDPSPAAYQPPSAGRHNARRCPPHARRGALAAALLLLAAPLAVHAAKEDAAALLAAAQAKLDAGDPAGALPLVERALKADGKLAAGYFARSTAHLMLGEQERGRADLDRAIALDPTLRQAYLNRAALAIAEGRHEPALLDFRRAREIAPDDPDGHLNVGAAELLLGRLDEAAKSFESYLAARPSDATAQYLVARNYAVGGYAGLAVQSLQQAIALDERMRASARMDASFRSLADNPRFQSLLNTDAYRPPAGAHAARREFDAAYLAGRGPLLGATLDALQALREPYEPRLDVGNEWAVVWGTMRIKISEAAGGRGIVELSAPAERFSAADWQRRSDMLLDSILVQLARRVPRS